MLPNKPDAAAAGAAAAASAGFEANREDGAPEAGLAPNREEPPALPAAAGADDADGTA